MTLQDQYNQINEGKGAKDVFLKHAKKSFPDMVPNHYGFDDSVKILKQRSVITENIWGIATMSTKQPDWFEIFNKNVKEAKEYTPSSQEVDVKATAKKFTTTPVVSRNFIVDQPVSKEVKDIESHAYNKETKKADNVIFDQLIRGVQFEMKNPKNADKTVDEIKNIVLKNLTKDPIWYTKNAMFGVEGLGYSEGGPGLGIPKEMKTKYAQLGGELVSNDKVKANVKDDKSENKKGMPKKVDQMTSTAKSSKGVQKMATPGKPKTIKPKN